MTSQDNLTTGGRFEIFVYYNGEYKWRLLNPAGEPVLESARSWKHRMKCVSNIPIAREFMARISRIDPKTYPLD